MLPTVDLKSADLNFFDAIAGRFDRLEQLLYDRFVYRTTAGTILGKSGLIRYLSNEPIRILLPEILARDLSTSDRTSVHRGTVRMRVHHRTDEQLVKADFLHVWIRADANWQLAYRESTTPETTTL